ncbi:MAG: hypothetical protein WAM82_33530 [Thermoanaerobaculia bacterium]
MTDVPPDVTNFKSVVTDAPSDVTDGRSDVTDETLVMTDVPSDVTDFKSVVTDEVTQTSGGATTSPPNFGALPMTCRSAHAVRMIPHRPCRRQSGSP